MLYVAVSGYRSFFVVLGKMTYWEVMKKQARTALRSTIDRVGLVGVATGITQPMVNNDGVDSVTGALFRPNSNTRLIARWTSMYSMLLDP